MKEREYYFGMPITDDTEEEIIEAINYEIEQERE